MHNTHAILLSFVFRFSSRTEERGCGLIRGGDKAKVSFDCCCLLLLSPKSNAIAIALLLSQCRKGGGSPSMGAGRQAVILEQGDVRDFGTS